MRPRLVACKRSGTSGPRPEGLVIIISAQEVASLRRPARLQISFSRYGSGSISSYVASTIYGRRSTRNANGYGGRRRVSSVVSFLDAISSDDATLRESGPW